MEAQGETDIVSEPPAGIGMTLEEWMRQRDAELLANYTPGAYDDRIMDKMGLSGFNTPARSSFAGSRPESKKSNRTTFSIPVAPPAADPGADELAANLLALSPYAGPAHVGGGRAKKKKHQPAPRPGTASTGISALTTSSAEVAVVGKNQTSFLAGPMNRRIAEQKRAHEKERAWLRQELDRQSRTSSSCGPSSSSGTRQ